MPKSAVHQTILHDHTSGIGPIINDRGSQVLRNESVYIYIYVHTKFQKKKKKLKSKYQEARQNQKT
jgi:hypothetical protein